MAPSGEPRDARSELETLREENRLLREELKAGRSAGGMSRKVWLSGGVGALAATAGAGLLGPASGVVAAPSPRPGRAAPGATVPGAHLPLEFYLQIVGEKQGRFIGDLDGDGLPDLMVGLKMDHRISAIADSGSGQATGKRRYQPLMIVKEWGAASPQIMQALATNETLTEVSIFLQKQIRPGVFGLVFQVRLENALVARFHQCVGDPSSETEGLPRILEEVAFTFQKIEWTSLVAKTQYQDDWQV